MSDFNNYMYRGNRYLIFDLAFLYNRFGMLEELILDEEILNIPKL